MNRCRRIVDHFLIRQQVFRQTEAEVLLLQQEAWDEWKLELEETIKDYRRDLAVTVRRLKELDDEGEPKSRRDRKNYEMIEERREADASFVEKAEKKLRTWLENNPRPGLEQ